MRFFYNCLSCNKRAGVHVRPRKHSCVQRLLHCSFQEGTECKGLMDSARHVIGCHLTRETRGLMDSARHIKGFH